MNEVELGRLKIIKRRAWNKERCVCQWLRRSLCAVARARAPTNGATADPATGRRVPKRSNVRNRTFPNQCVVSA